MKKNNKIILKFLIQLFGPTLMIYFLVLWGTLTTMDRSLIFKIWGIGLALMVVSALIIATSCAKKLSYLVKIANHISNGDVHIDKCDLQAVPTGITDELEQNMLLIIAKMKIHAQVAAQLAVGDLEQNIPTFSDEDIIGKSLISIGYSLGKIRKYTEDILNISIIDDCKHIDSEILGTYLSIIENINKKLIQINEKASFYENAMDAIPYPLHFLDPNSKWIFINKACDNLFQETNFAGPRESIYGNKYCKLNLTDCNTTGCNDTCSIYSLIDNNQTTFDLEIQESTIKKVYNILKIPQRIKLGLLKLP